MLQTDDRPLLMAYAHFRYWRGANETQEQYEQRLQRYIRLWLQNDANRPIAEVRSKNNEA